MGERFTAGEPLHGVKRSDWKTRRCGSVITTVINGVSRYGVVQKFIANARLTRDMFAVLTWLAPPSYPYNNPCVVRLKDDDICHEYLPRVISIFDIDPCSVCLERSVVESCFYVLRTHGTDTHPTFT